MTDKKKHKDLSHRLWIPIVVLIMGSILVMILMGYTYTREYRLFQYIYPQDDALMEIKGSVFQSHLWLDEYLLNNETIALNRFNTNASRAVKLSKALIAGGESDEHGFLIQPLQSPSMRSLAKTLLFLINKSNKLARPRLNRDDIKLIDSSLSKELKTVSKEIIETCQALEKEISREMIGQLAKLKSFMRTLLITWILMVITALFILVIEGKKLQDSNIRLRHLVKTTIDIKERLAVLEERLHYAQKMEAIGTLARGIAHDFNNILSIMVGYTEIALASELLAEDSSLQSSLKQVLTAGFRARNLINQIRTFSQESKIEKKPTSISSLVREVVKSLRPTIPATVEIRQNFDTELDTIPADSTQIYQIILNLCKNAMQAIGEEGGTLEIRLSEVSLDSLKQAEAYELKTGSYLMLSVSDTGSGIEPELKKRIFEPYFTTRAKSEGSGLGLSIVHGIVKNHGGAVQVDSDPGKGSTFNIFLPIPEKKAGYQEPNG
ncbi:MAG: nitrogen regulation protein NR(II) [bacterium]